ncbi:hypothetical protein [Bacillus vallismortis]|uniref:hypothetical protein n=1 Tax=Bacillus vallismortis TaxID=72361 RepID=UPI000288C796|nr:hypothetical protein [Bacillus vallismortis]MBG9770411.1 hypothetical protein [Bacillus vallismortis]MCI3984753.1 hypothetical protein [Bacillus vallismortis]MCI4138119.1 hypothetical protein [Bacillus vallismortis]MCY7891851.1 hypothetical protein [Bacillus vallismortis]MCY8424023.1 hypothetical protein [Bacillus vallismortis]
MNRNQAIIASLCYFSVFIAPIIVPIVAYFVVDEKETKRHAIRSLISHIVPFAGWLVLFIAFLGGAIAIDGDSLLPVFVMIGGAVIYFLVVIGIMVWNVIQGIKVLRAA